MTNSDDIQGLGRRVLAAPCGDAVARTARRHCLVGCSSCGAMAQAPARAGRALGRRVLAKRSCCTGAMELDGRACSASWPVCTVEFIPEYIIPNLTPACPEGCLHVRLPVQRRCTVQRGDIRSVLGTCPAMLARCSAQILVSCLPMVNLQAGHVQWRASPCHTAPSISAPPSSSKDTTSACPSLQARCKGVFLKKSCKSFHVSLSSAASKAVTAAA